MLCEYTRRVRERYTHVEYSLCHDYTVATRGRGCPRLRRMFLPQASKCIDVPVNFDSKDDIPI